MPPSVQSTAVIKAPSKSVVAPLKAEKPGRRHKLAREVAKDFAKDF